MVVISCQLVQLHSTVIEYDRGEFGFNFYTCHYTYIMYSTEVVAAHKM